MNTPILSDLFLMAEVEYKNFSASLMPDVEKERVLGVRIPVLRKYAKTLSDYRDFLNELPHTYYEENNLHAFLIERERNFEECIKKLDAFLPYVDNWATCDSMKPPVLKTQPEKLVGHIRRWIESKEIYTVRYGINLLMTYYLDENYDSSFPELVISVKSEEYYINMMRAWYFATALAKQYDSVLPYIENGRLDEWTHNKTIQKAVESFRISAQRKEYLKTLKIKTPKGMLQNGQKQV